MNRKQAIGMTIVVLGVLMVSTAQLTDIFGPAAAKTVTSLAGMLNSILGGWLTLINSDTATFNDTKAMTGVESIQINKNATPALAAQAIDPAEAKVEVKPGAELAVARIAGDA